MKKLLLFLLPIIGTAQPVLEQSYNAPNNQANISVIRITAGYKYMISSYVGTGFVKLYNSDHSLYKNINLNIPNGYIVYNVHVSDSLFNTDPSVEVLIAMSKPDYTANPITYANVAYVRSETGQPLFTINNCRIAQPVKFENGWKLLARIDSVTTVSASKLNVYSLVGAMPSTTPPKPGTTTGIEEEFIINSGDPFPNPSGDKVIVPYTLPTGINQADIIIYNINGQEIKRYQVDNTFSTLELNNSDLPSGTYLYTVEAQGQQSSARKFIIIK